MKQLVNERWGVIHHPTLVEIARMVHTVGDECGWDDIVIWKMDLRRAFSLLFIDPEHVQKLAFELTDGLTMMYITGMFG